MELRFTAEAGAEAEADGGYFLKFPSQNIVLQRIGSNSGIGPLPEAAPSVLRIKNSTLVDAKDNSEQFWVVLHKIDFLAIFRWIFENWSSSTSTTCDTPLIILQ